MKLFKSIGLCMSLALSIPGSYAKNDTIGSVFSEGIELVKNTAICAGLLAVPYLIGKGSSTVLLTLAQKRFDADICMLHYGNTTQLYQSINSYYNQRLNTSFISNNDPMQLFPLIRYKNDLDFYINSLWCLQVFNFGSEQRTQLQEMVRELTTLRANVMSWPQFTQEAQQFYLLQQKQNKNNKPA